MMRKIIEKIVVYTIFIIFLLSFFNKASLLFIRKGKGYGTDVLDFYKQERNTIDVLVLGSSHAYSAVNPYLIEEKTGLVTYDFCTQQQPIWITYHYLIEALKSQTPKYIILDINMVLVGDSNYAEEAVNRDAIDKMKMSKNKIEAINTSVEKLKDRESYYFNIIKYHPRYKELDDNDYQVAFQGKTVNNKGFTKLPKTGHVFPGVNSNYSETNEIYNKNLEYFNKIVQLAKKNNIPLILIKTPAAYDEQMLGKLNNFSKLADDYDITFLNYIDKIDILGLDYDNDFYDNGHLNELGSTKFTNRLIMDMGWQLKDK